MPYWQERDALTQQRTHTTARLRAVVWLADRYPDTAARLPLNPADRTPRRRPLAWASTLDRLRRLHPDDFHTRYQAELASIRGHRPAEEEVRRPARYAS